MPTEIVHGDAAVQRGRWMRMPHPSATQGFLVLVSCPMCGRIFCVSAMGRMIFYEGTVGGGPIACAFECGWIDEARLLGWAPPF